ncbi:hypothetical protein ACF07F_34775 [Streptomyces sp. NPDC015237]|uniref:hypothetical protein n=1 Tax=Streptomyces sp. NPDC015237 TaxID=3364949 RepID=UPI0037007A2C
MDGQVVVALIGGVSLLIGALVGSAASLGAAKYTGSQAGKAAVRAARSTYLGALDTARRSAQRDVFARFLTASQEWARQAAPAAEAALHWDQAVSEHLAHLNFAHGYVALNESVADRYRRRVSAVGSPRSITEAAQHVLLEAAGSDVVRAAHSVELHAVKLHDLLRDAGTAHFIAPDEVSRDDPTAYSANDPSRSPNQYAVFMAAINDFAEVAAEHLNHRELDEPGPLSRDSTWGDRSG